MTRNMQVLCFDLDNVICATKGNKYHESKPKKKIIKLINNLYKKGYIIKIFTARYMGKFKGNAKNSPLEPFLNKKNKKKINIAGKMKLNEWKGKRNIEFMIEDISIC